MSARIAPEPISSTSVALGDYRSRLPTQQMREPAVQLPDTRTPNLPPQPTNAQASGTPQAAVEAPPEPALPPGAMFAAAVIAGALPPNPETPHELALRIGGRWSPPDSDLRLTDRIA